MNNLILVKDTATINKIFETAQDKLVSLMYFTKNNPQCRTARQFFERCAQTHIISIFCIIDIDNFEGDVGHVTNFPHFDFFHMGRKIGTFPGSDQKGIEGSVQSGEQYVMRQNNIKNQSQIYNQQQVQQPQMYPQQPGYVPVQPMQQPVQQIPLVQPVQQPIQQPIQQQIFQQMVQQQTTDSIGLPSPQQMVLMFNVYQKLHQLGLLNMGQQITSNESSNQKIEGEEILPSGDKIIPLEDGRYVLIKKQN
uniref:Thioredoxin domain-containing protein n=1 Tax=viral metagenome TaxID=1070528 RepID=A0A6C0CB77_9ZZZZ